MPQPRSIERDGEAVFGFDIELKREKYQKKEKFNAYITKVENLDKKMGITSNKERDKKFKSLQRQTKDLLIELKCE